MRRTDLLINDVREETDSTEFNAETGVQDSSIIRAFNEAQDRIMSLIQQQKPDIFQKEFVIDAVSNQESYDLPVDIFGTHMLEKVEYSSTGQDKDYYQLDFGFLKERIVRTAGNPSFYIRKSSILLMQPRPQQAGKIRITYIRALAKVDKRRGVVSSVTLDGSTNTISNLVLDPTALTSEDIEALVAAEYFCVVDRDGLIKMQAIPIGSINSSDGTITVDTFTYDDGETIEVGDYVVTGKYTSSHSELPDIAERYLLQFGIWRIQKRDSSNDSQEAFAEKAEMENDILGTYSVKGNDICDVPVLDASFLSW